MSTIQQYISQLIQQINVWFPGLPPSLLLFFAILAGFIVLVLILVILRLFLAFVTVLFGGRRPRRLSRQVPARFYSTDWTKERERRRREFARRLRK